MKKSDDITLVLEVIGGLLFSAGMCMCLLAGMEWVFPGGHVHDAKLWYGK